MPKPAKPKIDAGQVSLDLARMDADAWIDHHKIKNEKGDPIEWIKHQFQIDIYNDQSQNLVVTKAAQVGLSTLEVLKNIRDAESNKMDIIYTLPTDGDVSVFVGGKVNRIISNNPHLEKLTADKDSIEQKQIGNSMLYFRGCVDEETELLTNRGWLRHDQVRVGDSLPSLNMGTNTIEKDTVGDITRFEVDEEMVRIHSSLMDQLVTKDHRCVISKRTLAGPKGSLRIARAKELVGKRSAHVPIRHLARHADPDPYFAILGWIIGDGSYWTKRDKSTWKRKDGTVSDKVYESRRVCIIQSKMCEQLEKDLVRAKISYYKKPHNKTCWRYEFSAEESRKVIKILPEKRLTFDVVFGSTQEQRVGLLHGLLMSDGDNHGGTSFWQNNNGTCDAFQALLVMLGKTSNITTRKGTKKQRVRIKKNEWTNPSISTERYRGIAWCPTTRNGTIFIRRNGKVSVTGQTWTKKAAIMITADRLVHDEKDSSKQDVVADYQARLQHSKFKQTHVFSHPSVPGHGVDVEWQRSDQKEWFIKCPHCKHEQMLTWDTENPKRMSVDLERRIFVCKKCHGELKWIDRAIGEWRAKKGKTGAKWSGYHVSLLMAPWVSANDVIEKYEEVLKDKQTMDYFYNKVLGLPYAGGDNVVAEETIKGAWTPEQNTYKGRIIIGVDTGIKLRYVYGNKQGLLGYGEMKDYMPDENNKLAKEETLEYFLQAFPDSIMVIDQGGDIIGPRKLRAKYPGRVFLCHYARDRKTMQLIRWGEGDEGGNVVVDRNRLIQLVIGEIKDRRMRLYRGQSREAWHEYWLHWHAIYRVVEEDKSTMMPRYVWVRSDRDDYVHCTVYFRVGVDKFGKSGDLISPEDSPDPNSYVIKQDHTVEMSPGEMFGDRNSTEEDPWWAKDHEDDWRKA